jgi:DNA repair protein RecO (recombination protein O)
VLGHAPSLDQCVVCGRAVAGEGRVAFGMTAGGVLCGECRGGRRGVVSVSSGVIAALRSAEEPDFPLDPAIHGELRGVMTNYLAHLVGHRLKTSALVGGK